MGRPRKTPLSEMEDMPPTPEEIEFEQFLEEIGPGTAVIHVLRMKPDGSRPQVGKTTMDQVREDPWEFLRSSFGPGKYMLLFRGSDRLMKGARVLEVEAPAGVVTSTATNGHGTTDEFQKTLMLTLIANLKPAPALDIGALLAGMGAMMTALKPAEAPKTVDPLAMFQSILTMYQSLKPKEEKSELDRLRDTAAVIKEFSGDSKGIEGPWDAVASVGKDVVEKLAPVLTGITTGTRAPVVAPNGATPAARPAEGVPVAAIGPATVPDGTTPAADPQQNLRNWIQTQIAFMKPKAAAGKDPGFWIDYIFENQEEPGCQALLYAIRQGATFEHLLAFDPEIGQNPSLTFWFKEVFNGVQAGLQGDVDSAGQAGNASDHSGNGSASAPGLQSADHRKSGASVS